MRAYFLDACRPRERWLVGMELEKLGRDADSGLPLPYRGDGASVRGVLDWLLERRGGDPIFEGNNLIGIDAAWGGISLEPGGQVEWSSRPSPDLDELDSQLRTHLGLMDEAAARLGVRWLDVSVDPEHAVEAMPWMPKARYKIMRPYMGDHGRLAHRMMTQTASIQCAFDFESAEDWALKMRAGGLLAPLATALFANSTHVDGADSGYRSYRQAIWAETDPDRCGVPAVVFEPGFSVDRWIDWVLDVPAMFRFRSRGLVPAGGLPFSRLLELTGCDALKPEDWELHLSGIFTDVRSYSYVEVRSADLLPDDAIMAVPTFWTGILYHADSLRGAIERCRAWDGADRWRRLMHDASRRGLAASTRSGPLRDAAAGRLAALAERHGLPPG